MTLDTPNTPVTEDAGEAGRRRDLTDLIGEAQPTAHLPDSTAQFVDGGAFRIEIPSVEGPAALRTVIDHAAALGVRVNRVSQGSGIYMLTDRELAEMAELGEQHDIEVCLFVGPRASWGTGAQARSTGGGSLASALKGPGELRAGTDDVVRAAAAGIRSILVADLGHLGVLSAMRAEGRLPHDIVFKVSAAVPVANAATAIVLAGLGANSLNLPSDLDGAGIASIRAAVNLPIDLYVESPDDLGGIVRHHEIPELVRVGAPIFLKFAVRNAPSLYPVGHHLDATVEALMRERVRRATLGIEHLRRTMPHCVQSIGSRHA